EIVGGDACAGDEVAVRLGRRHDRGSGRRGQQQYGCHGNQVPAEAKDAFHERSPEGAVPSWCEERLSWGGGVRVEELGTKRCAVAAGVSASRRGDQPRRKAASQEKARRSTTHSVADVAPRIS